ncbi:unnamed protein product [Echinostoma caproni]|uniref:Uncharacterized protein n=1 Tax=Echinostoma caproni TaxID=27848 RepID=A0A183A8H7_9TREM|nr:unnamed protein product [Echinostoma caproni]
MTRQVFNSEQNSSLHFLTHDIFLPIQLSAQALKSYYGSMPNLIADWTNEQDSYDPRSGPIIQGNMEDDVQLCLNQETKRDRISNQLKATHRTKSYNLVPTPENTAPMHPREALVWKPEHEPVPTFGDSPGGYPNRVLYGSPESESFISEQTEHEELPLTFTQAADALNNLRLDCPNPAPVRRRETGARSAESIYEGDDTLIEDNDPNTNFEKFFEDKIHEQNLLLKLMRMEQRNWEGRIVNALQYRNEASLENTLLKTVVKMEAWAFTGASTEKNQFYDPYSGITS